jgi:hypothetical protein
VTGVIWAKTIECDWPGCTEEAEASYDWQSPGSTRGTLPPGWLMLDDRAALWDGKGFNFTDFCPVHAQCSLTEATVALGMVRNAP